MKVEWEIHVMKTGVPTKFSSSCRGRPSRGSSFSAGGIFMPSTYSRPRARWYAYAYPLDGMANRKPLNESTGKRKREFLELTAS